MEKWNRLPKFGVCNWANFQLGQKSSKSHHVVKASKFDLKPSKYIWNALMMMILQKSYNRKKITPISIFSYRVQGFEQKHVIFNNMGHILWGTIPQTGDFRIANFTWLFQKRTNFLKLMMVYHECWMPFLHNISSQLLRTRRRCMNYVTRTRDKHHYLAAIIMRTHNDDDKINDDICLMIPYSLWSRLCDTCTGRPMAFLSYAPIDQAITAMCLQWNCGVKRSGFIPSFLLIQKIAHKGTTNSTITYRLQNWMSLADVTVAPYSEFVYAQIRWVFTVCSPLLTILFLVLLCAPLKDRVLS